MATAGAIRAVAGGLGVSLDASKAAYGILGHVKREIFKSFDTHKL